MTNSTRRLSLNREPSLPVATSAFWEVSDSSPNVDSLFWTKRFFQLVEVQPHIEAMVLSLAPSEEGTLAESYASKVNEMVLLGNQDEAPDLEFRQTQLMMCVYQDVGLVARAFMVEIGMKALLSLCGQRIKRLHRLSQLYDSLHPIAQRQLAVAYQRVENVPPLPDEIVRIPSIEAIFSTYDNLYTKTRYRPELVDKGPILSAWFHLNSAANTILFALLTHKSNMDMRHAYSISMEGTDKLE